MRRQARVTSDEQQVSFRLSKGGLEFPGSITELAVVELGIANLWYRALFYLYHRCPVSLCYSRQYGNARSETFDKKQSVEDQRINAALTAPVLNCLKTRRFNSGQGGREIETEM